MRKGWGQWVPYVLLALLAFAFVSPIFKNIRNTGVDDWDQFCFFDEVPRETILRYGQFPLWNPYYSGGRPLLANPQVGFLKPTFVFTLLFGCVVGLKIEIAVMLFLGLLGMFVLARHVGVSVLGAFLAAAVFGLSSYFSLRITEGLVSFFPMLLLPWPVLFYLRSLKERSQLVFAALFAAWMFLAGGAVHVIVPLALFLGTYGIVRGLKEQSIKPLAHAVLIVFIAFCIAGVKTVPTLDYLMEHPRPTNMTEPMTADAFMHMFLGREQQFRMRVFEEQPWGWHEYGAYIGLLPLLLFALGAWTFRKREAPLLVAGFAGLLIAAGNFEWFSPWNLLHRLPLLQSMHIAPRFSVLFILVAALVAGMGLDVARARWLRNRNVVLIGAVLVAFIIADLFLVSQPPLYEAFPMVPPAIAHAEQFTQILDTDLQRSGAHTSMYYNLLANTGTANGYDPIPDITAVKWHGHPAYHGEVFLEQGGAAAYEYWSPNKLVVRLAPTVPTRLVLNQNYDDGWRTIDRRQIENNKGLISVNVTLQDSRVVFVYRPPLVLLGALVSVVALAGCALSLRRNAMAIRCAIALFVVAGMLTAIALLVGATPEPTPLGIEADCPDRNPCRSCFQHQGATTCLNGTCGRGGVCMIDLWDYQSLQRTFFPAETIS